MGRFLQTDPLGYVDSMNLYQGFLMNPVNFVDPLGLWSLGKFLGGVWKGATNAYKESFKMLALSPIYYYESLSGAVETVKELLGKLPLFGVCMGHQILGLAVGAKTYKLKFGHRGGNQPVIDKISGRVEISSHNHGYAIDPKTLPSFAEVTHVNLNDKTVEGLLIRDANAFSVQYHPEACPGPHDSVELFQKFIH